MTVEQRDDQKPLLKPLHFIASAKRDLESFSEGVRSVMGYALYLAQANDQHESAKVLKGFGSAGTLEICDDDAGGTYRAVYTIRFAKAVYVLHAFQKKSTKGISTSKRDVDLIKSRLKLAGQHYKDTYDSTPQNQDKKPNKPRKG